MRLTNVANSHECNEFSDAKNFEKSMRPLQEIDTKEVASIAARENVEFSDSSPVTRLRNSNSSNEMPGFGSRDASLILRNSLVVNQLRRIDQLQNDKKVVGKSTLMRWCKFSFVGWMGIIVQFSALYFLKSVMHFNYLAATVIAVEAAVVHNFVWHEQFTWADRVQMSWRTSIPRFVRFNLATGGVSIMGNLALMEVMVSFGHMNYLVANAIAIVLCSLANFLVSEEWVFEKR
jgi:putative flippase GtrA